MLIPGSGESPLTKIHTHSVHNPTGMDVDLTTGNIYWIDRTLNTIFVSG